MQACNDAVIEPLETAAAPLLGTLRAKGASSLPMPLVALFLIVADAVVAAIFLIYICSSIAKVVTTVLGLYAVATRALAASKVTSVTKLE